MLLSEIKSADSVEAQTKNLGQKTNTYRALKTPAALRGVQNAENALIKVLKKN
jgi:hypothetical protein